MNSRLHHTPGGRGARHLWRIHMGQDGSIGEALTRQLGQTLGSQGDPDLSHLLAGFEAGHRLGKLFEGIDTIDRDRHRAVCHHRQRVLETPSD